MSTTRAVRHRPDFQGATEAQSPFIVTGTSVVVDNLNADLLDGFHASSFVQKSGDTMTGKLTVTSGVVNQGRIRLEETATSNSNAPGVELYNEGVFKGGLFYNENAGNIELWTGAAARISLDDVGQVGVGTAPVSTVAFSLYAQANHPQNTTSVYGFYSAYIVPSTATNASYYFVTQPRTAAAAFTLGTLGSFAAQAPTVGAGSAITTMLGFFAANQGASGVTNAYGVDVAAQSGASTLNVGIRIGTATQGALWFNSNAGDVSAGIAFRTDRSVALYSGTAGRLDTNAAFWASVGTGESVLLGGGSVGSIQMASQTGQAVIFMDEFSTSGVPHIRGRHARGTQSAPTNISAGDWLVYTSGWGYVGGAYRFAAYTLIDAESVDTTNNRIAGRHQWRHSIAGADTAVMGLSNAGDLSLHTGSLGAGVVTLNRAGSITSSGANLVVGTTSANHAYLYTNNVARWFVVDTSGHFYANSDNVYDFGASSGARARTAYLATSAVVGTSNPTTLSASGLNRSGAALILAVDTSHPIQFVTNNTTYWELTAGSGHWKPITDAQVDLGDSTHRVRNAYFSTSTTIGTSSAGIVTNTTTVNISGAAGFVGTGTSHAFHLMMDGSSRWNISTGGHFLATTDNAYDFGASGASRVRNMFVAGTITAGAAGTTRHVLYGGTTTVGYGGEVLELQGSGTIYPKMSWHAPGVVASQMALLAGGGFGFYAQDGVTWQDVKAANFYSGGTKVVGAQGAAIANADGTLADITTKFNALLARVRTHGLIAT